MDNITILEGQALVAFLISLGVDQPYGIRTVRIHQREDGVAYKINSGCWSPTIGRRADAGGY